MDPGELHAAAKRNIARLAALTAGRLGDVWSDNRRALIVGPAPVASAFVNTALRFDADLTAADVLDEASEHFGSRGHQFVFWTDDTTDADLASLLAACGARLVDAAPLPGMVIDEPVADGAEIGDIVRVDGPGELGALNEIVGHVYDFGIPMDRWLGPWPLPAPIHGYVLRYDGVPVSTAITVADQAGGLYLVATPEVKRRHGYGAAIAAHATNQMFDAGLPVVVLQASVVGSPIYARMGYRTYTTFSRWVVDPAPNAAPKSPQSSR